MDDETHRVEAIEPNLAAEPPQTADWAPEDLSPVVRSHRFEIAGSADIPADVRKVAEFWLNVADGDALWALVLASERLTDIVDKESFGFRRGRSVVMPTGLLHDEPL
jgi:hypothetical protein